MSNKLDAIFARAPEDDGRAAAAELSRLNSDVFKEQLLKKLFPHDVSLADDSLDRAATSLARLAQEVLRQPSHNLPLLACLLRKCAELSDIELIGRELAQGLPDLPVDRLRKVQVLATEVVAQFPQALMSCRGGTSLMTVLVVQTTDGTCVRTAVAENLAPYAESANELSAKICEIVAKYVNDAADTIVTVHGLKDNGPTKAS